MARIDPTKIGHIQKFIFSSNFLSSIPQTKKNILTCKTKEKLVTWGYDCVKKLPFCLESIPEALYGEVIRRSAIRASQVPGFRANQAKYLWQLSTQYIS